MQRGPIQCDGPVGVQTQPKLFVRAATGWSHHAQAIGWQERVHKNAIPKIQIILIFGNLEKDRLKKTVSQWSDCRAKVVS